MQHTREVIIELLSQLGGNREAREYLKRFSSVENNQFAVVKIGGGVLANELNELAAALAFLRHVGLFPIVLHGAGPQLNDALSKAGVDSQFVDNLRVTTPAVMKLARPIVYQQSQKLVDALEQLDVRARMIQHGVFEAEYLDQDRYGLVGKVAQIHLQGISSAIKAGALPIVSCFGESASGQVLNINADIAANALVKAIQPYKVVFLTPTGGLLNEHGKIISAINLVTEYQSLKTADWVHSGMLLKLEQIKALLDELPLSASVSITSAKHLTRELFTHRGSGTLIRRGEQFTAQTSIDAAERQQLCELLERCFERELNSDYFAKLPLHELIWSSSKRAAAVITKDPMGMSYMDKFAVTPNAQGEGLGAALWDQIRHRHPVMFWRSRSDNPINSWYFRHADVCLRLDRWRVFAIGIESMTQLQAAAEKVAAQPESWLSRETGV